MKKTIIIIFLIAVIQPMTAICLCSPIVTDHACCGDTVQHETKTKDTDNMTKGEKSVKPNETPIINTHDNKTITINNTAIDAELPDTTFRNAVIADQEKVGEGIEKVGGKISGSVATTSIADAGHKEKIWFPDTKKALWMAIVIPGGGQIYNRKYWKLPLVYGGFVGCIYALRWNGQMYSDYQQAYLDIMDDDPNTKSYEKFLHLGAQIDDSNIERYKTVFKNRKDKYRRWRDMSIFCMIGVYALSIIDAYVDASLSQFDVSDNLSMKIAPAFLDSRGQEMTASRNALDNGAVGVRCSLSF